MSKIYLVITPFFPSKDNFVGPYVYDQVKALQATGKYQIIVLKPGNYCHAADYEYEGINVYQFKSYSLPSGIFPGIFDFLSVRSLLAKLKDLKIEISNIAIVHTHVTGLGFYANALKKLNPGIKTVLQHHGFDVLSLDNGIFHRFQWHRSYVRKYGAGICNQIDLHVGVSAKTLEFLSSIPEINIRDRYVLYNGVDIQKFYPVSGLKDTSIYKIGCIANFWKLKDQMTLIKAVEILIHQGYFDIRVEFIGSGFTYGECVEYVNEHSLQPYITFTKEMFHQELLHFYNTLDLFVLPSYYESFGCVYTEAHACGIPFIAVEEQGISELIPGVDQDRWLIKPGDYVRLSQLIAQYKKEPVEQKLLRSIEIDLLIDKYLLKIEKMKISK